MRADNNNIQGLKLFFRLGLWGSFFICFWTPIFSQLPSNPIGSNPFKLKWYQINTDKVQVIFPQGMDTLGLRAVHLIHHMWDMDQSTVSDRKHKVPILLHGYNNRSNAFVTVAPFRSEFITTAPQFKNTLDWIDELTIHEYRHVQQFANGTKGITKVAKSIFGSWAWGGFLATALPRWYFEGDAVIAETALSEAGRGRFPEFLMEYHALIDDNKKYSYEKAAAGSLKDFVPSWYPLGYHMLSYGREKYGSNLWREVASDAVNYKGLLYPFGKSLKKRTGLTPSTLYDATYEDLKSKWNNVNNASAKSNTQIINNANKPTVVHYNAPAMASNGTIYCFRTGYDRLFELMKINPDGTETKLCNTGILLDRQLTTLSTNDNILVWSELAFDKRWRNANYSDIFTYDLIANKKNRLTIGKRYFSPDINKDGDKIVAVGIDEHFNQQLEIISTKNIENIVIKTGDAWSGLSYPKWYDDETVIYILTRDQRNQIRSLNISNGKDVELMPAISNHLSHLSVQGDRILFSMAENLRNNIFSIAYSDGMMTRLSHSDIGAFQPVKDSKEDILYYTEFTSQGYNIVKSPMRSESFNMDDDINKSFYTSELAQQEGGNIIPVIRQEDLEVKKFNRFTGLINPHSLLPEWTPNQFSLRLLSDNVFGTLSGEAGAYYNFNENEMSYAAGFTYAELYPIINLSYAKGNRNALFFNFSELTDTSLVQRLFVEDWNEYRLSTGLTLPYNFSNGDMINNVALRMNYQNSRIQIDRKETHMGDIRRDTISFSPGNAQSLREIYSDPISNNTIHTLDLRLNVQMFKLQALQHINSRLGLYVDMRYRANVGNNVLGGNNFLMQGDLYLPGIGRNDVIQINTTFQKEDILSNYRYPDIFIYPRGYDFSLRRDEFLKVGFNYGFPLFYPDKAISGLAFIKRIKANLFYDYGRFGITQFPFQESFANVSSAGIELGFDIRALRLLEIDFGLRYSYLFNDQFSPEGKRHQFDFFVISITE